MKNVKNNANNQDKMAALRIAEIKATDLEDLKECASDMTKTASLSSDEAIVVARAIRAKYLPNLAKQAGLDESNVKSLINLDKGIEDTADFANDDEEDEDIEMHHFEDDEEDLEEDLEEDEAEVDDSEMAKFEIEVPADMVDAAQEAVQKALDELLGGMDDSDEFEDDEELDFSDEDDDDYEDSDEDLDDEMDMEEDSEQMHKLSNGVKKMSKNAQNSRRAEREEILKKIAMAPDEYDSATAPKNYKSNSDMNFPGAVKFPTQTLENSGSNSLKEENPTWADQKLFTKSTENIQLKDQFNGFTLPGKEELSYTLDFDDTTIPSEGQMFDNPEIPTQMEHQTHNTTVMRTAAEKMAVECVTCGHRMALTEAEMDSASCPKCENHDEKDDKEASVIDVKNPATKITVSSDDSKKVIALETARIKTAFSCSSKLAVAGIIDANEMDSYADQMLNDGLKADAMIRQTKLLLKSSQTNTERVAAAAAERMNSVRTASTMGISTSPAFSGGLTSNGAALDIQAALKGTWSMPQIED
jgi:hypothetical protein